MNEWISVKERLPEGIPSMNVLVALAGQPHTQVGYCGAADRKWHSPDGYFLRGVVTHWMPLPEPPTASRSTTGNTK